MKNSSPPVFSQPQIENTESMQTELTKIIEEIQQRARTCETAAQDANEQALTGELNAREKNTQNANEWTIKSKIWLEAEVLVRECLPGRPDRMMASSACMSRG